MSRIFSYALAILILAGLLSFGAQAQVMINVGYEPEEKPRTIPLNTRNRSPSEFPTVKAGLQPSIFSRALGNVTALSLGQDGELYSLDSRSGRITVMTDRNRDGQPDITRKLSVQFNGPRSMVASEGVLYVADQDAVWAYNDGEKRLLASLSNVDFDESYLPLILTPDGQHLYLAVTDRNRQSRIIAINKSSGHAANLASGPGPVRAMAQTKGSSLWLGIGNTLVPVVNGEFELTLARKFAFADGIEAIYLPDADSLNAQGLGFLAGQFLVALEQKFFSHGQTQTARNVVSIGSTFGRPDGDIKSVVDGFLGNHGRSAWGAPGAMVWDERGLFLADRQSGIIWRVHRLVPKITFSDKPAPVKFYEEDEIKTPKASWGSSIKSGSSIITGSTLATEWPDSGLIPKETLMEQMRREDKEATDKDD